MYKLIVNKPTGAQSIIEIGRNGRYYDDNLVVWDERTDGRLEMTRAEFGGYKKVDGKLVFDQVLKDAHDLAMSLAVDIVAVKKAAIVVARDKSKTPTERIDSLLVHLGLD